MLSDIFKARDEMRQREKSELFQTFQDAVAEPVRLTEAEFVKVQAACVRFDEYVAANIGNVSATDLPRDISKLITQRMQLGNMTEARDCLREIPRITADALWGPKAEPDRLCFDSITGSILARLSHMRGRAAAIDRLRFQLEYIVKQYREQAQWHEAVFGNSRRSDAPARVEIPAPKPRPGVKVDAEFNP